MFNRLTVRLPDEPIYIPDENKWSVTDEFSAKCLIGEVVDRLAAYEDSGLSSEQVQELAKAKADGRLVVLPCKVGDLQEKYRELTKPEPDEAETYTTGYRNGIRNGQAELIAYLLQIDTGTKEAAEKAIGGETERGKEG